MGKAAIGAETASSLLRRGSVGPYRLTGENFTRFATERPRLYQAGLFFTADSDVCPDCAGSLAEYTAAAQLFDEQYELSSVDVGNVIFFFVISASDSPELFKSLGIVFAPQLFVIGPKTEQDARQPLSDFEINLLTGDLIKAISDKSGVAITRLQDPSYAMALLLPAAALLALLVTAALEDPTGAGTWYRSRIIWIPVCAVSAEHPVLKVSG